MYEDSTVRFSKRINFDVGCQMDFSDYPVDMQSCEVKFESYSYRVHEVFFEWGGDLVENEDITLPGYVHHIHLVNSIKRFMCIEL